MGNSNHLDIEYNQNSLHFFQFLSSLLTLTEQFSFVIFTLLFLDLFITQLNFVIHFTLCVLSLVSANQVTVVEKCRKAAITGK